MADEQDEDVVIVFTPDTDLFWDLYGLDLEVEFEPESE
jgi:hypothetical protein